MRQLKHKIQLYRDRFKAKEEMLHFPTNLMTLKLCQVVRIDDQLNQAWVVTNKPQVADDGNLLNIIIPVASLLIDFRYSQSNMLSSTLVPKPLFSVCTRLR